MISFRQCIVNFRWHHSRVLAAASLVFLPCRFRTETIPPLEKTGTLIPSRVRQALRINRRNRRGK